MSRANPKPPMSRREQILDEAAKLFVAHGVGQVTTRQIAQAVGISQPSLYAHFSTREAIAVELCKRAFDELQMRLQAASAAGGPTLERLSRLCQEYITFGLTHDAAYRVAFMLEMPKENSADKQVIVDAGVGCFGVLEAVFQETHGADARLAAQSAWASLHGLVSLILARKDFPWSEQEPLISLHIEGVCHAARASQQRRSPTLT